LRRATVDLDSAGTSRIEHGRDLVATVQELIFELIERSWPRAGEERDECVLSDAEAVGTGVKFQTDHEEAAL